MANKWLIHVKKTMKVMKRKGTYKKGLGLSQVIKEAKKNWHSVKKGGSEHMGGKKGGADAEAEEEDPAAMKAEEEQDPATMEAGRRRRASRKTKRHGKSRRH